MALSVRHRAFATLGALLASVACTAAPASAQECAAAEPAPGASAPAPAPASSPAAPAPKAAKAKTRTKTSAQAKHKQRQARKRARARKRAQARKRARAAACGDAPAAPPAGAPPSIVDAIASVLDAATDDPATVATPPAASTTGRPRPFAADSPWNTPIPATATASSRTPGTLTTLLKDLTGYDPWIATTSYSAPVYMVGPGTPLVDVVQDSITWRTNPGFKGVPLPAGAKPADGTDASLVVWQPSTDTMWEFWRLRRTPDGWHAMWGGRLDNVSSSSGVFPAPFGTSASSMALIGGMIRPEEIRAGRIEHALAMGVPSTGPGFVAPAVRSDGKHPGGIPLGTRLRLDPAIDVASLHLSRVATIIAIAAQRYGIYVRDTSGAVPFYAEDPGSGPNPWPELFGHQNARKVLDGFPWSRLQVINP
ncbi:MAG: hypothetical protein ACJ762_14585 [Solirubrobacteraceae bacterium]